MIKSIITASIIALTGLTGTAALADPRDEDIKRVAKMDAYNRLCPVMPYAHSRRLGWISYWRDQLRSFYGDEAVNDETKRAESLAMEIKAGPAQGIFGLDHWCRVNYEWTGMPTIAHRDPDRDLADYINAHRHRYGPLRKDRDGNWTLMGGFWVIDNPAVLKAIR